MKKVFTLIAMALLTMSASAEVVASYDAGTKVGTWSIVGTKADQTLLEYTAKYNSNSTAVTTITFPNSATSEGAWQYAAKVEGEFKKGDVITIQPFTSMSNADFTGGAKYANILLYSEEVKQIADLTGSAAGALTVTDGHEEAGDPKTFTYTLEADYTNLYFARGGNTRINLMKVTITRGESGGDSGEGGEGGDTELESIVSYNAGTKVGTWSIVGTKADQTLLEYTAKYNSNSTAVTTITFPNSATSEGAWQYAAKVEGEFKKGDVITIQPFTSMSNADFTGGAKYANILLYSEEVKQIADLTGSAAGALTVTDGHEEAGDPKTFTYTLEADYTNLYFARGGNTRINLMKVDISRPKAPTAIETVKVTKANDNAIYNLAGQKVGANYKGIAIINGRKVVLK